MLDRVDKGLRDLYYLTQLLGEDTEINNNKAIKDIHNDALALLDVYHSYNYYRNEYISEDSFRIAYNIYRSKRGSEIYED